MNLKGIWFALLLLGCTIALFGENSYQFDFPTGSKILANKRIRLLPEYLPWDLLSGEATHLDGQTFLHRETIEGLVHDYNSVVLESQKLTRRGFSLGEASFNGVPGEREATFQGTINFESGGGEWVFIPLFPDPAIALVDFENLTPGFEIFPLQGHDHSQGFTGIGLLAKGQGTARISLGFKVQLGQPRTGHLLGFTHSPFPSLHFSLALPRPKIEGHLNGGRNLIIDRATPGATLFRWESGGEKRTELQWFEPFVQSINDTTGESPAPTPVEPTEKTIPVVFLQQEYFVSAGDGFARGQATLELTISRAPVSEILLAVPEGMAILDVAGQHYESHDRLAGDGLRIQFKKKTKGTHRLHVLFEYRLEPDKGPFRFIPLRGRDINRDRGYLIFETPSSMALRGFTIPPEKANILLRQDPSELPTTLQGKSLRPQLLAFKFSDPDFHLDLDFQIFPETTPVSSFIDRGKILHYVTEDNSAILAQYHIQQIKKQFLTFQLPHGYRLLSCHLEQNQIKATSDGPNSIKIRLTGDCRGQTLNMVFEKRETLAGLYGAIPLALPAVDVPIGSLEWGFAAPPGYHFFKSRGDAEPLHPRDPFLFRHLRFFITLFWSSAPWGASFDENSLVNEWYDNLQERGVKAGAVHGGTGFRFPYHPPHLIRHKLLVGEGHRLGVTLLHLKWTLEWPLFALATLFGVVFFVVLERCPSLSRRTILFIVFTALLLAFESALPHIPAFAFCWLYPYLGAKVADLAWRYAGYLKNQFFPSEGPMAPEIGESSPPPKETGHVA